MTATTAKRHRHWFTQLYWTLGQYGRQDVHIHSCIEDERDADGFVVNTCDRCIVGAGRVCGGTETSHRRMTLGQRWSERRNEGAAL